MAKATVVDFTNVTTGGGRIRVPEGDYRVKVKSVKHDTSGQGNPMLVWEFEFVEGKHKGKVIRDRTTLTEKSLWRLKNLLEAMGIEVPNKRVALRLEKYFGQELGITAIDDEYEGKISSKVGDYLSVDVLDADDADEDEDVEDEDEEEEPAPKSKKGKKGKKGKKAKSEDEEEEIADLDLDEL